MNKTEFPEESDSSDEDYLPGNCQTEVVSEVDSDGDPEDPLSDKEDENDGDRKKRKRKATKIRKKIKNDSHDTNDVTEDKKELSEVEKKKHADDLWASFKKDTGFKSKVPPSKTSPATIPNSTNTLSKAPEKIKITQIFEFAGEEVEVEKEVAINSTEARLLSKPSSSDQPKKGRARTGGLGGIGSVLSHLGKKQKITTLEKSKLDWDKFKKEENIEEELRSFNKGKDGYLERQDFLQRADLRRFEIEKEIRTIERNKRMNDV